MCALRAAAIRLLAVLALLVAPAAWADYYVVVSESNPTVKLSQKEALHIFMGRTRSFPDGGLVAAYEVGDDSERAGFYRSLDGMSLAQVTSYWARLMFSGRSLPPQQVDTQAALMDKVRNNPQAIGWLPHPPAQRGLRTVLVLRNEP
jgi:hypothetical protein